jgi:hypothetical protein
MGTAETSSGGVKYPVREADHPLRCTAKAGCHQHFFSGGKLVFQERAARKFGYKRPLRLFLMIVLSIQGTRNNSKRIILIFGVWYISFFFDLHFL